MPQRDFCCEMDYYLSENSWANKDTDYFIFSVIPFHVIFPPFLLIKINNNSNNNRIFTLQHWLQSNFTKSVCDKSGIKVNVTTKL